MQPVKRAIETIDDQASKRVSFGRNNSIHEFNAEDINVRYAHVLKEIAEEIEFAQKCIDRAAGGQASYPSFCTRLMASSEHVV
jgi:hypothetical protein